MKPLRLALFGFGTVGQWLAEALHTQRAWLQQEFGLVVSIIAIATAHHGLISRDDGLDIPTLLDLVATRQPLTAHPIGHPLDEHLGGIAGDINGDVLAEATGATLRNGEPGLSLYSRGACCKACTSSPPVKAPWPWQDWNCCPSHEPRACNCGWSQRSCREHPCSAPFARGWREPGSVRIRGILNGTANSILSAMAQGSGYAEALAQAQALGYAEADPTDDVEGDDAVAKTLILAAVAFGRALAPSQVVRQGITTLTREQVQQAHAQGKRIKHVASLRLLSLDGTEVSRETADNGHRPHTLRSACRTSSPAALGSTGSY